MRSLVCLSAFILLASSLSAQTQSSNEIITQGSAKLKVKADVASFRFAIEKRDTVESRAIAALNKEANKLIEVLNRLGFRNSDIKISDYDISTSTSSYNYENESDPKVYNARNTLSLTFRLDTKTVDAIYQSIEKENVADTDISFDTELSDSLSRITKSRLIQLAIADAKSKAEDIALGLGQKLGKVKTVHHENRMYALYEKNGNYKVSANFDFALTYQTSFVKLEPEEKELEDTVTITFELVK